MSTTSPTTTPIPPLPIIYRSSTSPSAFHAATWSRVFNHAVHAAHSNNTKADDDDDDDDVRLPHAIVTPTHPSHITTALSLAAHLHRPISIRSGGHSWAAWSVRAGAILLDLAHLHGDDGEAITYDADTHIVSCGPAVTGRVLNEFLAPRGRFFAGGHCPDVGLGGFLLQGGMGWNCKNWGWACESVVAVEVVTAQGEAKTCSEHENADLFWAARGAGPGFPAVVTRFRLKTRPLEGVYQSVYLYPASEYHTVLQWVIDTSETSHPGMEIVCLALYPPSSTSIHILANFLIFTPSAAEALSALTPIHASHPPNATTASFAQPSSLAEQYHAQDISSPVNMRYCTDNAYLFNNIEPPLIDLPVSEILEPAFLTLPTPRSFALYFAMYPTSRRPLPDMALSMQSDHYFAVYAIWEDAADDERVRGWVRQTMRAVEVDSVGSYLGDADFQARGSRFWGVAQGKRLEEVRRKWDPEGIFCGFLDGGRGMRNEHDWIRDDARDD
ncbi:hypothetical protein G7046_g5683 [Stylonectria norvegica]|nr:hypothetical protein G7046_g5683 [Stylonectria norvegica]